MIRLASALPLLALMSATPLAAQAARDFQLPPAPTPSADTRVQGPVDTDAPVPVRPRAIEPARPTPTPTASASPATVLPAPASSQPAAQTRVPGARPTATAQRSSLAPAPNATATSTGSAPIRPASTSAPLALPSAPAQSPAGFPVAQPASPVEAPFRWLWLALPAVLLAAGGALVFWRRRSAAADTPKIIAPHVPATSPGEALAISVDAVRMDRSVMNATVGYRITIRNRTTQALSGVAVEADLVSASRHRPAEQQLASPDQALTPRHAAERLAPGGTLRFEGQARMPLSEASAIWQGRAALLVPLLRVRATADGAAPVATTLVIGRKEGSTARPQPFRLDEPPRSYAPLAQRVLDAMPARA